ncbi:NADH-quinone oxidoreductase subunit J [Kyrpidia tusciae]|uniref:NADH-quinone oxidoreductase subunit J n=1 Tax=Kyrpidia tusciae (strain DSM 2912 / NBRC 15312 / T2) TaxID=562970 RepID=D5WV49_KYRT2|nr:NADH-quinone oxidoreductase subunit J [Kyrpidia tusciae]ADG07521.1 NADH-ubiquinone/plastoquinone oxidoreductase chain 6 [Kyrpidia tusciae DSM 2912]
MAQNVITFFLLAGVAIAGAFLMFRSKRIVHMVLSIALSFLSLAGLFAVLGAEFLFVAQLIVYSGAITILAVFSIMLTRHEPAGPAVGAAGFKRWFRLAVPLGLFALLAWIILDTPIAVGQLTEVIGPMNMAEALFAPRYLLSFELLGVLLLVALVGAIVMAKEEMEKVGDRR